MEAEAMYEQNRATASGCSFHNFSSLFDYQVLCYSGHGDVPPASCQSYTEMLSSRSPTTDSCSHVSPSEPTPSPPQNGNDVDTSGFAEMFKFG
jgi:hypothetical protein